LYKLHPLDAFVRVDAGRIVAGDGVFLAEAGSGLDIFFGWAVELFLKDRLCVNGLELGLEVVQHLSAAVGSTSLVDKSIAGVVGFVNDGAPVAPTRSLLLDAFRVSVEVAGFGKVARETIFGNSSTVGKTSVVSIVVLDGSSHVQE